MKKLILFLLMAPMAPICAFAADQDEICRRNTLVMAVLRTDAETTALARNVTTGGMLKNKHWKVDLGYDIFAQMRPELWDSAAQEYKTHYIYGSATCNGRDVRSSPDGKSNNAGPASFGDTNTFLKASVKDVGVNCWCKMDGPVTSWWTYLKKYDTNDDCKNNCTRLCATAFAKNTNIDGGNTGVLIRNALYNKVW